MAKPGLHLIRECEYCKKPYRQSRGDQRYCSRRCGKAAWMTLHPGYYTTSRMGEAPLCRWCGKLVSEYPLRWRFCSDNCSSAADKQRKKQERAAVVPGKHWAKGREIVPRRTCETCGGRFYAQPKLVRRGGGRFCSVGCKAQHMSEHRELWPMIRH
mgnify:CR=1 FL=1